MANKIKLTRPDNVQGSAREFLFKLCLQIEKILNAIMKNSEKSEADLSDKLSENLERINELSEKVSGLEERIKEVEESI